MLDLPAGVEHAISRLSAQFVTFRTELGKVKVAREETKKSARRQTGQNARDFTVDTTAP